MISTALFVRLEAKPGKEEEVASFLKSGFALVQQEPATVACSASGWGLQPSGSLMRSPTK